MYKRQVIDDINQREIMYTDATCPFVKKIHNIVRKLDSDTAVLIAGDENHPEVLGIRSYCNGDSFVFRNVDELEKIIQNTKCGVKSPAVCVSQTTFSQNEWKKCEKFIKKVCTNIKIFDTICNATCMRQSEAQSLAEQCEAMIVIGDRKSSNTTRLAELCRAHCPLVYHISRAEELDRRKVSGVASVGITAGASTPGWIIKEVKDKMSEEMNNAMEIEESFADMLEKSIKTLNTGEKVTGVVTGLSLIHI